MQSVSSAKTSVHQVNPLVKNLLTKLVGLTVLDIGGGKFDANKQYAVQIGVNLYVYDRFNRSEAENRAALVCRPEVVICNNVLNVIDDGQALRDVIALCASFQVPCYFTTYEGNKSGIGSKTKPDCWQRNWKTPQYIPILRKFFRQVKRRGNLIICQ